MKWYRSFFPTCKYPLLVAGLTLLLVALLLFFRMDAAGVHVGSLTIPVRAGDAAAGFLFRSLWRTWMTITAFVSPVVWLMGAEHRMRRVLRFQLGLWVVLMLPVAIRMAALPAGRLVFLSAAHVMILNGFLLLFTLLMGAGGAAVTMTMVQLTGPAIRYLHDFKDFLPDAWGTGAVLMYRELPFFQKLLVMGEGGDTGVIWPDLVLAAAVLALEGIRRWRRHRRKPAEES